MRIVVPQRLRGHRTTSGVNGMGASEEGEPPDLSAHYYIDIVHSIPEALEGKKERLSRLTWKNVLSYSEI